MSENHEGTRLIAPHEPELSGAKKKPAVQAEAQTRLRTSGYHELHLISCNFHEGVLSLRGRVSSFYLKQVAQTVVRELDGVDEINNRLEVAAPPGAL
jgi:osmotically-inducible protein OsmY